MAMVDGAVNVVSFNIQPSLFRQISDKSDNAGAADDLD
jgi:hypothetical protein